MSDKYIIAAGLLPITIHNEDIYVLLGKETYVKGFAGSSLYADFVGRRDPGESILDCALREGYEELMGIYGSISSLRKRMDESVYIQTATVRSYLLRVPYDPHLPAYFKNVFNYARKVSDEPFPISGYYEKQAVKWFRLSDLKKMLSEGGVEIGGDKMRPEFIPTLKKLLGSI